MSSEIAGMTISGTTTMGEILNAYPSARLELFRRYHVGGCTACGYQLTDTLEQVCQEHEIPDPLAQVIEYIRNSREVESKLQILPTVLVKSIQNSPPTEPSPVVSVSGDDLRKVLQGSETWHLVDVRSPEEWERDHLPNGQLLTTEFKFEVLDSWPKDTPILFYSNSGRRGLETASYFVAYGFTNVRNLAGGLNALRAQQPGFEVVESEKP
jgi:rhodanese-related sulfurtransferase